MRKLSFVVVLAVLAAPAFAGFSVDLPIVAGLQGVSTRFYTAVDVTNYSAQPTDVSFEYISTDYTVEAHGTLVTGLPAHGNFHTDDVIIYLANHGFLTADQAKNSKGTMLLTFTNPAFLEGSEAAVTVRTYNFLTPGQPASVGYSYRGFVVRGEGAHALSAVIGDTSTASSGVPVVITNLGVEDVGINDQGQVDTAPVTVQLTFVDPATGHQVGPQPTVTLKPGQVTQINNVWTTYSLSHSAQNLLLTLAETAGTAQIRAYVIEKDVTTNDGSIFFAQ
ncbi:MAG TPA: hypothetical protein VLW17_01105 [Thermoanaerobaculaceae bacterium]|nr:hypothetical protein [Thermoanaerobaculaceae bacterium]